MNKREVYRQKRAARLKEWEARIAALKAQAAEAGLEANNRVGDALKGLEAQRDRLADRIKESGQSTGAAWREVKKGFTGAFRELKASFRQARATIKGGSRPGKAKK
jgi:hypothetical protein